jgi:hypothetical protein
LDVFEKYGLPFLRMLHQSMAAPDWARDQFSVMLNACIPVTALVNQAFRLALLLGDFEAAQSVLSASPPTSPQFRLNMFKWALLGVEGAIATVEMAASQLMTCDFIDDALEMLLITGNWEMAVEKLIGVDRPIEAATVCRAQEFSEQKQIHLNRIAMKFVEDGNIPLALKLFSEAGNKHAIAAQLDMLSEADQAACLRRP